MNKPTMKIINFNGEVDEFIMQKITIINYDELKKNDPLLIQAKKEIKQLLNKNKQKHNVQNKTN